MAERVPGAPGTDQSSSLLVLPLPSLSVRGLASTSTIPTASEGAIMRPEPRAMGDATDVDEPGTV
jgi:hypothetical protein